MGTPRVKNDVNCQLAVDLINEADKLLNRETPKTHKTLIAFKVELSEFPKKLSLWDRKVVEMDRFCDHCFDVCGPALAEKEQEVARLERVILDKIHGPGMAARLEK